MTRKPGAHSRNAPEPDPARTRISQAEARRLLAGRPVHDEQNLDLQRLFKAATAPGLSSTANSASNTPSDSGLLRSQEPPQYRGAHQPSNQAPETADAGLSAVLAAFNAAPTPTRPSRAPMRYRWSRTFAVKLLAVFLLLSGAGMSAAAAAGVLPASVQHAVHDVFGGLGVPGPPTGGTPGPIRHQGASPTGTTTGPSPEAGAGAPTPTRGSANPSPTALCESAARDEYVSHALDPADQAALIADAGGATKVIPYCLRILASVGYGNGDNGYGNGNNHNWSAPTTPAKPTAPSHTTKPPSTAPTAGNGQNRTTPPDVPEPTRTSR